MFSQERNQNRFTWDDLGNPNTGRPNLGHDAPVALYRLLQYTMRDVISTRFDGATANEILVESGQLAGKEFCKNLIDPSIPMNAFIAQLQQVFREWKIGILRFEKMDPDKLEMVLTIAEDLDCSGLPVTNETVCHYDEGFIAGILETYTQKQFNVKEIDCWASGGRVCRFIANPVNEETDDR